MLDPAKAKDVLIGYVIANRDKFTGATIANKLSNVKAFCENGFNLDWRIIRRKAPPVGYVGVDRAPTVEETRMLEGNRLTFVILAMASGGFRVGAWQWQKVGRLSIWESGLGELTTYRGEPEECVRLISPGAANARRSYKNERESVGRKINAESPLVRDKWEPSNLDSVKQASIPSNRVMVTTKLRVVRRPTNLCSCSSPS